MRDPSGTHRAFLYKDEQMVVIRPLRPIMASHVLIGPRTHSRNANWLTASHCELPVRMHCAAKAVMIKITESQACHERKGVKTRRSRRSVQDFHTLVPPSNSSDHVQMHVFDDNSRSLGYYGRI